MSSTFKPAHVTVFRDLKPENFLLSNKDPNAPLKATDFGLSVFYHPGQTFNDIVGSAYYVAPEVTPHTLRERQYISIQLKWFIPCRKSSLQLAFVQ